MKRSRDELVIQNAIEAALGAEPDLLLLRNVVTMPPIVGDDGKVHRFPVGLGKGSPDLVGILRLSALVTSPPNRFVPVGAWFCLEVKRPGEVPSPDQVACHRVWRRFGAWVSVVTSVEEARAELAAARRWIG